MTKSFSTALVCLIALAAAGCAVELPKSAWSGFRLAPADDGSKRPTRSQERQAPKPDTANQP